MLVLELGVTLGLELGLGLEMPRVRNLSLIHI